MKKTLYKKDLIWSVEVRGRVFRVSEGVSENQTVFQYKKEDEETALRIAKRLYQEQKAKGYKPSIGNKIVKGLKKVADDLEKGKQLKTKHVKIKILPMIPTELKGRPIYPCFVQPYVDGVRCLLWIDKDGQCKMLNEKGGDVPNLNRISKDCAKQGLKNIVLDGFIRSSRIPTKILKKAIETGKYSRRVANLLHSIQYAISDCIILDNLSCKFQERYHLVNQTFKMDCHCYPLRTHLCFDKNSFNRLVDYFSQHFRGIVIRNRDGIYTIGKESKNVKLLRFENDNKSKQ